MPALHQIIVRPVVTEKSSAAYQTRKEYAFEVHPEANKYQIRDALQKLFGVTATAVAEHVEVNTPVRVDKTPGRNEPCYCGSGKKFKLCHGR